MSKKITELTEDTTVKPSDVTVVIDLAANESKKATIQNVLAGSDGIVATLTGSTFSGPIIAPSAGGITGSITRTATGLPFITVPAGNIITVSTGSDGQIILSGSGDGTGGGGGGTPGGSTTQLQYNNAGSFGGISGATFDGSALSLALPVTASLGISASFVTLPGSGNAWPSNGALRLPYNSGATDKVIRALNDAASEVNVLSYGPGNTFTHGHVGANHYVDAFAIQTVAASSGQSHYYNGTWSQYNYARAAYDAYFNSTGLHFGNKVGIAELYTEAVPSTDSILYVSGTLNLENGNSGRRVAVFGGDVVHSGSVSHGGPRLGHLAPYSSEGFRMLSGSDAGVTLTSDQYRHSFFMLNPGTATGMWQVVLPNPADDDHAYCKWFSNQSGYNVSISCGTVATQSLSSTGTGWFLFRNGYVEVM